MSPTASVEDGERGHHDRTARRHAKRYLLLKLETRVEYYSDSSRRQKRCRPNSAEVLWGQVGSRNGLHLGGREARNRGGAAEVGPAAEIDD